MQVAVDAAGLLVGLNRAALLRLGVRPLCEAIGVQSDTQGEGTPVTGVSGASRSLAECVSPVFPAVTAVAVMTSQSGSIAMWAL